MIKKQLTILIPILIGSLVFAQKEKEKSPSAKEVLKELSEKSCKCIDSIDGYNKTKDVINKEISSCIEQNVLVYSMAKTFEKTTADIESGKIKDQKVNVTINSNPESYQYKQAYFEIETDVMANCTRLRDLTSAAESKHDLLSKDPIALEFYNKAIDASEKEDWKEAINNYEQALKKDPKFIYAWDNLGICYRRIGEYDKALDAYKKSLKVDPKGKMPLQNIPIAYIHKKEYSKAINAYLELDKIYPNDAEVYYGIGQVYYDHLKDNEKALDYIAKAYNIYTTQKSPYRSDAEAIIGYVYKKMKDEGKADKFKEILKKNNIRFE